MINFLGSLYIFLIHFNWVNHQVIDLSDISVLYICQKLHRTVTFYLNTAYHSTHWAFCCMDAISLFNWLGPNVNMNTTLQPIMCNSPCDTSVVQDNEEITLIAFAYSSVNVTSICLKFTRILSSEIQEFFGELIQTGCPRRKGQYSRRSYYLYF